LKYSHERNLRRGHFALTAAPKPEFEFSEDGKELKLRGYTIDRISKLGSTLSPPYGESITQNEDRISDHFEWYLQAKDIFQTTGKDEEVLWRTLVGNMRGRDKQAKVVDHTYEQYFQAYKSVCKHLVETGQHMMAAGNTLASNFSRDCCYAAQYRRFCVLNDGLVGLVPAASAVGDLIAAFLGTYIPYVIRPVSTDSDSSQKYELIGPCYIHDIMNGQVEQMCLEVQNIVLI